MLLCAWRTDLTSFSVNFLVSFWRCVCVLGELCVCVCVAYPMFFLVITCILHGTVLQWLWNIHVVYSYSRKMLQRFPTALRPSLIYTILQDKTSSRLLQYNLLTIPLSKHHLFDTEYKMHMFWLLIHKHQYLSDTHPCSRTAAKENAY